MSRARAVGTAVLFAVFLSVTPGAAQVAQDPERLEVLRAAANVRVPLLTQFRHHMGGVNVRVLDASVARLDAEGVFTIQPTRYRLGFGLRPREVIVIVPTGQSVVSRGTPVVVVGHVRTLEGVEASGDVPWVTTLEPRVLRRMRARPIVVAMSVQTADGVELMRP